MLLRKLRRRYRRQMPRATQRTESIPPRHVGRGVEAMEPRMLLSVEPVFVGAVYIEEDLGNDVQGDTIQISFQGGAPGTQLTQLAINGDQNNPGFNVGDVFFDTEDGALGADAAFPFTVHQHDGIDVVHGTVQDGTSALLLEFEGFDSGETLVLSIDVDEVEDFDPDEIDLTIVNEGFDPITSGVEFQGSTLRAVFQAPHFHTAEALATFTNRYDDELQGSGLNLPADDDGGKRDRTAGGIGQVLQQAIPASLGGHVYHDRNQNGQRDPGEEGIGGVSVQAIPVDTLVPQQIATVQTDQFGGYLFEGLAPGIYRLIEVDQPAGYFDGLDAAGTVDGVPSGRAVNPGDAIEQINLGGGSVGVDYDFGEIEPVSLSGSVHLAGENGDCFSEDVYHAPVAGALVWVEDVNGTILAETVTDQDGFYQFTGLAPGSYTIVEVTPDGLFDGAAQAGLVDGLTRGQVQGSGRISQITLRSGENGVRYDFCEEEPVSLSGSVHLAGEGGDCFSDDVFHAAVAGAVVWVEDANGTIVAETVTDQAGHYQFTGLAPGTYTIVEVTPEGLFDGAAQAGTVAGLTRGLVEGSGRISQITLVSGEDGVRYDFCEEEPVSLSGSVQLAGEDGDCFGDDVFHAAVAGAVVWVEDANGTIIAETVTDQDGHYQFTGLAPGTYSVVEVTPEGLFDGAAQAGTVDGVTRGRVEGRGRITQIRLTSGEDGVRYDFCEQGPVSISGRVHLSNPAGDCFDETDTRYLPNVVVRLVDEAGQTIAETRTDQAGRYQFLDLAPGVYSVVEITPSGFIDGAAHVGTINGHEVGTVIDAGRLAGIRLDSGEQAVNYDFCEHEPSSLSGFVYHDRDNDGIREADEEAIDDVTLVLTNSTGQVVARAQTNANGFYEFHGLLAGRYAIRETQPEGWIDGIDSRGWIGERRMGTPSNPGDTINEIDLRWSETGRDFDFGELQPASIAGIVHVDLNADCLIQEDERPIAAVRVELLNDAGQVVDATTTGEDGRFRFAGLSPGTYTLRELQPRGYFHGGQRSGSGGGDASRDDLISGITVGSADTLVDYAFCEEPPSLISGFVFQDGPPIILAEGEELPHDISTIRDGVLTPDDRRLANVVLELRNGITGEPIRAETHTLSGSYPRGTISTTTDARGFYAFDGLKKGNYAVYQIQPEGYIDGIDTGGTMPSLAINRHEEIEPTILAQLSEDPRSDPNFDAIIRIVLPPGRAAERNNFSEIITQPERLIVPFEGPDPAPIPRPYQIQLPVFPSHPVDVELLDYQLKPFGHSQSAWAHTWHLSVIDGGQPRGEGKIVPPRGPVWFEAAGHRIDWLDDSAHELEWTLLIPNGETMQRTFGVAGALPITGDFDGDGLSEIGVFSEGQWFIDLDGDGTWDQEDLWAKLGHQGDLPVTGDWDGDGKDDIGIYGLAWPGDPIAVDREPGLPDRESESSGERKNVPPEEREAIQGRRELKRTADGDTRSDVIDHVFHYGAIGDHPVSGDWNGDGVNSVGVFHKGLWHLDRDGNGRYTDRDTEAEFGEPGDLPIVGDFNGDGVDEIAVYRNGTFIMDTNRNFRIDGDDLVVTAPKGRPVVGDWNGDGRDDVGVVGNAMRFAEIDPRE